MTEGFPLADFIAGRMPADGFDHRQHVRAGHALLAHRDFADSARLYVRAISAMAGAAGHPEKFHMTITLAMLSAIAERLPDKRSNFDAFAAEHTELFERGFLLRHYSEERLQCDLARRTFLLPDRAL
jgi:hypothetical protein